MVDKKISVHGCIDIKDHQHRILWPNCLIFNKVSLSVANYFEYVQGVPKTQTLMSCFSFYDQNRVSLWFILMKLWFLNKNNTIQNGEVTVRIVMCKFCIMFAFFNDFCTECQVKFK